MSVSLVNDVGSTIVIGDEPRRKLPSAAANIAQGRRSLLVADLPSIFEGGTKPDPSLRALVTVDGVDRED
jgi:hypothetical protein